MSGSASHYKEKLEREQHWHVESRFKRGHFLNSKLFYSQERTEFNFNFARMQMARLADQLAEVHGMRQPGILIAPVGSGHDVPFIETVSKNLVGIDISPEAIGQVTYSGIKLYVGDMRNMTCFPNASFDIVVTSLFYHHFLQFGFDEFLRETLRVIRPGGILIAMEPSSLHPLHWITGLGKKIFGNITNALEDEAPFRPGRLTAALRRCGFEDVDLQAASFSHHRLPIPIARLNNFLTAPLKRLPLLRSFGWCCLVYGRKPSE
jgi:SAM-dependent methyltransferase